MVRIENHGSIVLLRPLDDDCRTWLLSHTDGSWFGDALAVEPRYVMDLLFGMAEEGIDVERRAS